LSNGSCQMEFVVITSGGLTRRSKYKESSSWSTAHSFIGEGSPLTGSAEASIRYSDSSNKWTIKRGVMSINTGGLPDNSQISSVNLIVTDGTANSAGYSSTIQFRNFAAGHDMSSPTIFSDTIAAPVSGSFMNFLNYESINESAPVSISLGVAGVNKIGHSLYGVTCDQDAPVEPLSGYQCGFKIKQAKLQVVFIP